jgi:sulfonate transport system permease protein
MEGRVVSASDDSAGPRGAGRLVRCAGTWAVQIALVILWEIAARAGWLRVRVLPAPSSILMALSTTIEDRTLLRHVAISTQRGIEGPAIGGGLGSLLGIMTGGFRIAETLLDSTLQMLRNVPHLAIIPMVILWFGIGEEAKIFLVAGLVSHLSISTRSTASARSMAGGSMARGPVRCFGGSSCLPRYHR